MAQAQDAFVWEAPAWDRYERGPYWYALMAVGAILLALYGIFTSNYLFSFIIILIAIILVLAGNEEPRTSLIQVGENGIVVDGRMYFFDTLQNFAIIYHPPETKVLYVEHKTPIRPRLRLSLSDEDPVAIRAHLKRHLAEDLDLQDEHVSDILARLLRL